MRARTASMEEVFDQTSPYKEGKVQNPTSRFFSESTRQGTDSDSPDQEGYPNMRGNFEEDTKNNEEGMKSEPSYQLLSGQDLQNHQQPLLKIGDNDW